MKPIRIVHHQQRKLQTYLESYLRRRRIPFEVQCVDQNNPLLMDLEGLAGLVFMGGAGNVNQPTDYMQQELQLIRQAAEQDLPMMGVCLGAQLISKALGGAVCQNSSLEVGWHRVLKTHAIEHASWFADLPGQFEVFQWHAHIYEKPPGASVLAGNDCFSEQAYVLNNILAMQFHLEMTHEMIDYLIESYPEDLQEASTCVQDAQQIRAQLAERLQGLHERADAVYDAWLRCVYWDVC